jgi:hypothetical protein
MVALAVLATAFTAMLGLHVRNIHVIARERAYTQALLLARTLIADLELGPLPEVGTSSGDFEGRYPEQYTGFRWEQAVLETPFPNTREATVRVIPPEGEGAASELTLFLRPEGS